ncbi:deoxyribodipyrimidine photo-lyase/cryptochrome family protein [Granulosicoccus sp.]|nr:FAD-binding domain-containing protein [Granulosicoccus sp.]MDB4222515.1 deoxyribodipyrimidine photo-lyase/cryptochrome family protein [Granulosicoccus sp.]
MPARYNRVIWWIKRDARIADNEALTAAVLHSESVLPLFVFEVSVQTASDASIFHAHAQWCAVNSLSNSIKELGGSVQFATGEIDTVLDTLFQSDGFDAIYSHEETGTDITYSRDLKVAAWCIKNNVAWLQCSQNGVVRKLSSRDDRSKIVKQRLLETKPFQQPKKIVSWQSTTLLSEIPAFDSLNVRQSHCQPIFDRVQYVTEHQAVEDCLEFLHSRGIGYSGGISSPNSAFKAGSRLSAHLAWGTISLRTVFSLSNQRLRALSQSSGGSTSQWVKSIRAFQARLFWHDHFVQRLESAPEMEFQALNPAYQSIAYFDDPEIKDAWLNGRTGIPLVDACMRCLKATGFLNFRMRAMVVTTACYGLGQSWISIQDPLARTFLDYEPGIHLSQIQMQAGIVGINTIRVYSPLKQLLDHDPQCIFVKKWVPELREFDASTIACYETRKLGNYPLPILDIQEMGKLMKNQIYSIRNSQEGKKASAAVLLEHGSRRSTSRRVNARKKREPNDKSDSPQLTLDF